MSLVPGRAGCCFMADCFHVTQTMTCACEIRSRIVGKLCPGFIARVHQHLVAQGRISQTQKLSYVDIVFGSFYVLLLPFDFVRREIVTTQ